HALCELDQQCVERTDDDLGLLNSPRLLFKHLDPFGEREERPFVGVDGHPDNQPIDQFASALDDIEVPIRNGIERAWIKPDPRLAHSPPSSPASSRRSAATTCSSSPTLMRITPWVARPAIRISLTPVLISCPLSVTSSSSCSSVTGKDAVIRASG